MDEMEQHYTALIEQAIRTGMETSPRTQQSRAGLIGPSDIGFCRNKAALVVKEVQPTDETDPWAAAVGIALHNYVEDNLNKADFGWLVEKQKVTATLPRSGAQITGTPDIIDPVNERHPRPQVGRRPEEDRVLRDDQGPPVPAAPVRDGCCGCRAPRREPTGLCG